MIDRAYRPKIAWPVVIITIITMVAGLFLRFYIANEIGIIDAAQLIDECVTFIIAILAMAVAYLFDYTILSLKPIVFYSLFNLSIIALAVSYMTERYVPYLLIVFPVVFSGVMYNQSISNWPRIAKCIMLQTLSVLLFIFAGELPIAMLCAVIGFFMLALNLEKDMLRKKVFCLGIATIVNLVIVFIAILADNNTLQMCKELLNVQAGTRGCGYISDQISNIISSSKWVGTADYPIPDSLTSSALTNYFITYLIYKLGWLSFIGIALLFIVYFLFMFYLSSKQKNRLGQLLVRGIIILLVVQSLIYVLSNIRFGMIFTMPLPFVSYGRISLILNSFAIGLVLSVFRQDSLWIRENLKLQASGQQ